MFARRSKRWLVSSSVWRSAKLRSQRSTRDGPHSSVTLFSVIKTWSIQKQDILHISFEQHSYCDDASGLTVTSLDVISVEPLDKQTKDLLEESVKKTVVITTEASLKAAQVFYYHINFFYADLNFSTLRSWLPNKKRRNPRLSSKLKIPQIISLEKKNETCSGSGDQRTLSWKAKL